MKSSSDVHRLFLRQPPRGLSHLRRLELSFSNHRDRLFRTVGGIFPTNLTNPAALDSFGQPQATGPVLWDYLLQGLRKAVPNLSQLDVHFSIQIDHGWVLRLFGGDLSSPEVDGKHEDVWVLPDLCMVTFGSLHIVRFRQAGRGMVQLEDIDLNEEESEASTEEP